MNMRFPPRRTRARLLSGLPLYFGWLLLAGLVQASEPAATKYSNERRLMVKDQIASRGVRDEAVLRAMRDTPRHLFVPEPLSPQAYDDGPLPIGHGQTISQPYIVAFMSEIIRPRAGMKVLEIGAGSGYQAAVLAEMGIVVYTVEIIPELEKRARENLAAAGYDAVHLKQGDGYFGWPEHAPFDAIVVTAAAEHIPPPLIEQLGDGGRMIIPVGSRFMTQHLVLVEKEKGEVRTRAVMPVRFVPFTRSAP